MKYVHKLVIVGVRGELQKEVCLVFTSSLLEYRLTSQIYNKKPVSGQLCQLLAFILLETQVLSCS